MKTINDELKQIFAAYPVRIQYRETRMYFALFPHKPRYIAKAKRKYGNVNKMNREHVFGRAWLYKLNKNIKILNLLADTCATA